MCCSENGEHCGGELENRTGKSGLMGVAHAGPLNAIAISGRSGCGNTSVNLLVAEQLGCTGINYTMRSYAEEQNLRLEDVARRAERDLSLDRLIDRRQVELCLQHRNVVLSSRLAIWLLPKAALKVYLYASPSVRSRRIHQREGGDLCEQQRKTAERDARDAARYQKLYGIDTDEFLFADLVINSEAFDQYQVADLIVRAYLGLASKTKRLKENT